jgi:hypothetical protein
MFALSKLKDTPSIQSGDRFRSYPTKNYDCLDFIEMTIFIVILFLTIALGCLLGKYSHYSIVKQIHFHLFTRILTEGSKITDDRKLKQAGLQYRNHSEFLLIWDSVQ